MDKKSILKLPLLGFSGLRTIHYFVQFQALTRLTATLPFVHIKPKTMAKADFENLLKELRRLTEQDVDNIASGVYPMQVLKPESIVEHTLRLPKLFIDGIRISRRRTTQQSKVFSREVKHQSAHLPDYYKRNFHFQTDGYLSENSAELYEHQVELLFSGMGDAMRRLFIKDLKAALGKQTPQRALEIGCGTGRTTRFMRLAFPQTEITATDLSSPYLKVAQKKLANLDHINFMQADATQLPFKDENFDVVYNVFLFHELPRAEREKTLSEALRVLKPGGYIAIVDSLQFGDQPEFDKHLRQFPVEFHEPFYADYTKTPMSHLLEKAGFHKIIGGNAFLAKYLVAQKPI